MVEPTNTNYCHKLYSSLNFSSRNCFFHSQLILFFLFDIHTFTSLILFFFSKIPSIPFYHVYLSENGLFFYCFSLSHLFEISKVFNASHITLRNSLSSNQASLSKIAYFVTSALWPMITRIYLTKFCNKDYFS
jgi:hypothetical protein